MVFLLRRAISILGEHDRLPQNTLHTVLSMLTIVIMTLTVFHPKIYRFNNHCFLLLSSLLSCYIAIIQIVLHIPLTYHIYHYVQSRTSPLHAQFSFDDCSVPLNLFKYITSDSSLRLSQQPYSRFFPPTEWCCLCDPLISVLVKYCRFPFLYTVTSRFSGSIIH